MTSPVQVPAAVRRHRSFDAFAGAHRVVFEQVREFLVDADFTLPRLTDVSPEVHDGPPERSRAAADYYDTPGLDLAAAGFEVRWNVQARDWTVVLPAESLTDQPIRCEAGFPGVPDVVPDAVHALLHLHAHHRRLEKVARVVADRSTTPLISTTGIRLAEVIDEQVVAGAGDGDGERAYRCVRVTVFDLDGLGCGVLADVCALLAQAGCRTEAPAAELARAFGRPSWPR